MAYPMGTVKPGTQTCFACVKRIPRNIPIGHLRQYISRLVPNVCFGSGT